MAPATRKKLSIILSKQVEKSCLILYFILFFYFYDHNHREQEDAAVADQEPSSTCLGLAGGPAFFVLFWKRAAGTLQT